MKGYALVTKVSECYGHGDYGEELAMKQKNAYAGELDFPPVFLNKEKADEYLKDFQFNWNMQVAEIDIV